RAHHGARAEGGRGGRVGRGQPAHRPSSAVAGHSVGGVSKRPYETSAAPATRIIRIAPERDLALAHAVCRSGATATWMRSGGDVAPAIPGTKSATVLVRRQAFRDRRPSPAWVRVTAPAGSSSAAARRARRRTGSRRRRRPAPRRTTADPCRAEADRDASLRRLIERVGPDRLPAPHRDPVGAHGDRTDRGARILAAEAVPSRAE